MADMNLILKHLNENYPLNQQLQDITNFLTENFAEKDNLQEAKILRDILDSLKKMGYILFTDHPIKQGDGGQLGAYHSSQKQYPINTRILKAALTIPGYYYIKELKQQDLIEKQTNSIIETNTSVKTTNRAIVNNLGFQKCSQIWSIALAGLSTIFILATVIQSVLDKTPQHLKDIKTQVQEQSKALKSLETSLKEINSSIQKLKIDSVFLKTKK